MSWILAYDPGRMSRSMYRYQTPVTFFHVLVALSYFSAQYLFGPPFPSPKSTIPHDIPRTLMSCRLVTFCQSTVTVIGPTKSDRNRPRNFVSGHAVPVSPSRFTYVFEWKYL